ncbi:hypothetical protein K1719_020145 [Acacia pycnantha]|nr:hypothetical protein K1719_020145 [Acacia pycnantha]
MLHCKGGASVLAICHSNYQKIKAHTRAVADEIGCDFHHNEVALEIVNSVYKQARFRNHRRDSRVVEHRNLRAKYESHREAKPGRISNSSTESQQLGPFTPPLRSVKPRTFQNRSPLSPMSPMDFSMSPELPNPSVFSSYRFGLPLLQQSRPQTMNLPNAALSRAGFPYFNGNLVQESETRVMDHRLQELERQLLEDNDEEERRCSVCDRRLRVVNPESHKSLRHIEANFFVAYLLYNLDDDDVFFIRPFTYFHPNWLLCQHHKP